ncbi:MazG-like family protein [Oceanobacillus sp. J11TS1]|uniref:MazG-like family protein n=1 Tax=Oceanobacillus sp. J11TS1 TaxID=2807191 RepID=UPI001B106A9E|nr:MazG-like family protein [Oceanobacillus sp. J11TS1]GIO25362.1 hypothetical protein J11TS1_39430 [Oceanobacillus sp. J11TS1]
MPNLNATTDLIRQWGIDRGLDKAAPEKQMMKLMEEVGELAEGLAKGDGDKILDSIGDTYVVLTNLSEQLGFRVEDCIERAYLEIANRKGKMVNGVFVKEADLR